MSVLQLVYHVVELRLITGDGGEGELSLSLGEPESGPVGPEMRKAHSRPVDVSSLGAVRSLLHDVLRFSTGPQMWDTVGLLEMTITALQQITVFIVHSPVVHRAV